MSVIAAIKSNPDINHLGLKSRSLEEVNGMTILEHVVKRLNDIPDISKIMLFSDQIHTLTETLEKKYNIECMVGNFPDVNVRESMIRARKWSLESWRGGVFYTMSFDEFANPYLMNWIFDKEDPSGVLVVNDTSLFLDKDIITRLCQLHEHHKKTEMFYFTQAAVSMGGEIYCRIITRSLQEKNVTIRSALYYNPEKTERDFILRPSNLFLERKYRYTRGRFSADTKRHFEMMKKLWSDLPDPENATGIELLDLYTSDHSYRSDSGPREVIIEITSRNNYECEFMPNGKTGRDGDMSLENFKKVIDGLPDYDDICLTFGGFGEPLLHPELPEMINYAKQKGVFGIHIETDGIMFDEEMYNKLLNTDVDLVSFTLLANEPETFKKLTGVDRLKKIEENLLMTVEKRKEFKYAHMMTFPEIIKMKDVESEIEEFFDKWYNNFGWTVIRSFNDYCGEFEDKSTIHLYPSQRKICVKLTDRMTVFSDGSVPVCGQDFKASQVLGNAFETPISEIWNCEKLVELRQAHVEGKHVCNPLCAKCKDWYYL